MEFWLWSLCSLLICVTILLICKIHVLKKSAEEISDAFSDRLHTETNTLIDISSRDPHMRRLAEEINCQLRILRKERRRFLQGDLQLKEAVTDICHDLRTPLTAVCGYLDLLEQEEVSASVRHSLSVIRNRADALTELTGELFHYSLLASVEEEKLEPVDLKALLEESLASFYGAMKQRKVVPEISMPGLPVKRMLNSTAAARIFGNILSNALKYSGGDLQVSMDEEGEIVFANTAPELTPVMAGRLFDRYYTVEAGENSTGLGLSIARLLTERMGGEISSRCIDGKLRITLRFPQHS